MANLNPYDKAVKESINVDFKTRMSPQKVILCNRENQFYGKFVGKAQFEDVDIKGGTLQDVALSNVAIYDTDGNRVDLSVISEQIAELAQIVDEEIPQITADISVLQDGLSSLSAVVVDFQGIVGSVSSVLSSEISSDRERMDGIELSVYAVADGISAIYGLSSDVKNALLSVEGFSEEISQMRNEVDGISSEVSHAIEGMSCDIPVPAGCMVKGVSQKDGKVSVLTSEIGPEDLSSASIVSSDLTDGGRIGFLYDSSNKAILLGVVDDNRYRPEFQAFQASPLSIDCSDFIKDGMLCSVYVSDKKIHFVFNVASGNIDVPLSDMFDGVLQGESPIHVENNCSILLDEVRLVNDIKGDIKNYISGDTEFRDGMKAYVLDDRHFQDISAYYDFLAGMGQWHDDGEIARLSGDVA